MIHSTLRSSFFLFFISALPAIAFGQESTLRLKSARNEDKSVTISFEKQDYGTYTVFLGFRELTNSSLPHREFALQGSSGDVTVLRPINKDQSINFSYTYRYARGKINTKLDKDFVYVLPYPSGSTVRSVEARYLNTRVFGMDTPPDWKSYVFYTKEELPVIASRKGTIVEVQDEFESDNLEDFEYTSKKNTLLIEHEDGTLARYGGFKKGSVKVKVGQTVFPGEELGYNAKLGNNRYGVTFQTYYLKAVDFDFFKGDSKTRPSLYHFVTPVFAVNSGSGTVLDHQKEYQSYSDESLITKEMSKKEIRKYKK